MHIISPPFDKNQADWSQKYRPASLEDTILPDSIKSRLIALRDNDAGLSLLFHGDAGTGKTTAALLLNDYCNNFRIKCSLHRGIEMVRELDRPDFHTPMVFGGRRTFILDEADYLTDEAQAAFRGLIEKLSGTSIFVFTANYPNKIIGPLHSRLQPVDFNFRGNVELMNVMIKRALDILKLESIDADNRVVEKVVLDNFPDMRQVLKRLQYHYGLKVT